MGVIRPSKNFLCSFVREIVIMTITALKGWCVFKGTRMILYPGALVVTRTFKKRTIVSWTRTGLGMYPLAKLRPLLSNLHLHLSLPILHLPLSLPTLRLPLPLPIRLLPLSVIRRLPLSVIRRLPLSVIRRLPLSVIRLTVQWQIQFPPIYPRDCSYLLHTPPLSLGQSLAVYQNRLTILGGNHQHHLVNAKETVTKIVIAVQECIASNEMQ